MTLNQIITNLNLEIKNFNHSCYTTQATLVLDVTDFQPVQNAEL